MNCYFIFKLYAPTPLGGVWSQNYREIEKEARLLGASVTSATWLHRHGKEPIITEHPEVVVKACKKEGTPEVKTPAYTTVTWFGTELRELIAVK